MTVTLQFCNDMVIFWYYIGSYTPHKQVTLRGANIMFDLNFAKMKASLTFFGSNVTRLFDYNKSLHENFVAICSLPCYKSDSEATVKLIQTIKSCDLSCSQTPPNKAERMQVIAKLELV